ncbi:hypothetical protein ElyMa_000720100 [Elysia marginata]|uniref:Uncharacterized protein n=1 Tax=Elysia marginata TaxID=1093978 RepID=A0AAV4GLV8_9GAST|nr:hypothetical protein ElyMa_000720100 [Elysia marginata]
MNEALFFTCLSRHSWAAGLYFIFQRFFSVLKRGRSLCDPNQSCSVTAKNGLNMWGAGPPGHSQDVEDDKVHVTPALTEAAKSIIIKLSFQRLPSPLTRASIFML